MRSYCYSTGSGSSSTSSSPHPSVANKSVDLLTCPRCGSFTKQLASAGTLVNNNVDVVCPKCGNSELVKA